MECKNYTGFLLPQLPKREPEAKLLGGAEDREWEIQTESSQGKGCSVFLLNECARQQKRDVGRHCDSLDWLSSSESPPPWGGEN